MVMATKGNLQYGPFDGIIITAATQEIPDKLLQQLKTGGRLVVPLGDNNSQVMTLVSANREEEFLDYSSHGNFVFVPMLKGIVNGN